MAEMRTCSYWVCVLLCCGIDLTCPAESAIVNMLYRLGAALNKLCSKSRCMSHRQPASAAEDTVSRFLYEAFSSRKIKKRERAERPVNNTLWLVSRDFRFKQPACEDKHVCTHNCKHAPRLARTQEQRQQGIKYGGVGNARNLPAGKLW